MKKNSEEIKELLHTHNLKATKQRIAIYEALSRLGHTSADTIVDIMKSDFPELTVATVYNVLDSFVKAGIVSKRLSHATKMHFDVTTSEHIHLYDSNRNKFKDLEQPELFELVRNYISEMNMDDFDLESIDLQLVGHFRN